MWNQGSALLDGDVRVVSRKLLIVVTLIAFGCAMFVSRAQAASIEYPNFSSVSGLQLNGDALQSTDALRLTSNTFDQQSSAFYGAPINPSESWSTQFEITMYEAGGIAPADGIAFLLQNDPRGDKAVSTSDEGGAMGYSGILPSLGTEFDIYDGNPGDPEADHIGIIENGDPTKYLACATEDAILPPCDKDFDFPLYSKESTPVFGWITYESASSTLSVYASNTATQPCEPLLQTVVNLGSTLGTSAFAGFTSGTGSGDAKQEVLNWRFSSGIQARPGCPSKIASSGSPTTGPHSTATQVICNLVIATASDICTATVGDGGSPPSNPTGTVKFSSANGGVFSAGNTCNLLSTPNSGSVSSCSVQFLPPSNPSSLPAITAGYSGDGAHSASSGQTHYPSISELARDLTFFGTDTIPSNDEDVEVPLECGFPCDVEGELSSSESQISGEEAITSVLRPNIAAIAAKKHGKKKTPKSVVLGKGSLKLTKPGKGALVIKLAPKTKSALKKAKIKSFKATLTITIKTPNGTLVATEKKTITIHPAKKKPKKKSKH
jgi:hypothetical protein